MAFDELHCPCQHAYFTTPLEPELLSDVSVSVLLTKEGVCARGDAWEETP